MIDFGAGAVMVIEPIAISIALTYFFGILGRSKPNRFLEHLVLGSIFGTASIYAMANPINFGDDFVFDLRNLFIGLAAAFFGWSAGLLTLLMGVAMRLNIGGTEVWLGILGMLIATAMGLLWHCRTKNWSNEPPKSFLLLGMMISAHLAVCVILPAERQQSLATIAPIVVILNLIGAYVLGRLLQRENHIVSQVNDLEIAAKTDSLTNLMNRRTLLDAIAKFPKRQHPTKGCSVIFLDIDHFKAVNDAYGHRVGDQVLKQIVRRIRADLRPNDLFARLGGDEFVVVLPEIFEDAGKAAAERFRKAVSRYPIDTSGHSIHATVSLGVAWSRDLNCFDSILNDADKELYKSKTAGRNKVTYQSPSVTHVPHDAVNRGPRHASSGA